MCSKIYGLMGMCSSPSFQSGNCGTYSSIGLPQVVFPVYYFKQLANVLNKKAKTLADRYVLPTCHLRLQSRSNHTTYRKVPTLQEKQFFQRLTFCLSKLKQPRLELPKPIKIKFARHFKLEPYEAL